MKTNFLATEITERVKNCPSQKHGMSRKFRSISWITQSRFVNE